MRKLLVVCVLGVLFTGACDLGLDPDSLVRDLRVLAIRVGPPGPMGVSDVAFDQPSVSLGLLAPIPSGPGRRLATASPLLADWYLCLAGQSLIAATGSLDPNCTGFHNGQTKPDGSPAVQTNSARAYITSGLNPTVPLANLAQVLSSKVVMMLGGGGGLGPGVTLPIELQIPLVVRATDVPGSMDIRDSEVAFAYARTVYPPTMPAPCPPGMAAPCPNHNPALGQLTASLVSATDPSAAVLKPCVDGQPCSPFPVPRGTMSLYLTPSAQQGSDEVYVPLDQSGRTTATEVPRYSWFSTDGQFSQLRTGGDQLYTVWGNQPPYQAPDSVNIVDIWVVLQDERGGADWQHYQLSLTK